MPHISLVFWGLFLPILLIVPLGSGALKCFERAILQLMHFTFILYFINYAMGKVVLEFSYNEA